MRYRAFYVPDIVIPISFEFALSYRVQFRFGLEFGVIA